MPSLICHNRYDDLAKGGYLAGQFSEGLLTLYMVMMGGFERGNLDTQNRGANILFFLFTLLGTFLFANLLIAIYRAITI